MFRPLICEFDTEITLTKSCMQIIQGIEMSHTSLIFSNLTFLLFLAFQSSAFLQRKWWWKRMPVVKKQMSRSYLVDYIMVFYPWYKAVKVRALHFSPFEVVHPVAPYMCCCCSILMIKTEKITLINFEFHRVWFITDISTMLLQNYYELMKLLPYFSIRNLNTSINYVYSFIYVFKY